jgi:hypothetical protein
MKHVKDLAMELKRLEKVAAQTEKEFSAYYTQFTSIVSDCVAHASMPSAAAAMDVDSPMRPASATPAVAASSPGAAYVNPEIPRQPPDPMSVESAMNRALADQAQRMAEIEQENFEQRMAERRAADAAASRKRKRLEDKERAEPAKFAKLSGNGLRQVQLPTLFATEKGPAPLPVVETAAAASSTLYDSDNDVVMADVDDELLRPRNRFIDDEAAEGDDDDEDE